MARDRLATALSRALWLALGVLGLALIWASLVRTEFLPQRVLGIGPKGQEAFVRLISALAQPDLSVLPEIADGMWESIAMGLIGTLLAVVASLLTCFLAARNLTFGTPQGKAVYLVVRTVYNVVRAFPPIVLAMLFVVLWGVGPLAGVMALAVHSVGMLGKLFAEAIEGADPGPIEAVRSTGASPIQVVAYGILPQVLPHFVAYSVYRWDINIRMSIVLGVVGAGGIGNLLQQYFGYLKYEQISTTFLAILVVVTALDLASGWIRERLGVVSSPV